MDALKKIFILTTSLVLAGIILWVIWTALSLFLVLGGFKMAKEIMNNTINKPPIVQQQKPTPKPKPKLSEAEKKAIAAKKAREIEQRRLSAEFEKNYKPQDPKCKYKNIDYAYYCIQKRMDAKKEFIRKHNK